MAPVVPASHTRTAANASGMNTPHAMKSRASMHQVVSPAARSASPRVIPTASKSCHSTDMESMDAPTLTSAAEPSGSCAKSDMMASGSAR
jgi:hypothetical protein